MRGSIPFHSQLQPGSESLGKRSATTTLFNNPYVHKLGTKRNPPGWDLNRRSPLSDMGTVVGQISKQKLPMFDIIFSLFAELLVMPFFLAANPPFISCLYV